MLFSVTWQVMAGEDVVHVDMAYLGLSDGRRGCCSVLTWPK